jgi:hypothetical protein
MHFLRLLLACSGDDPVTDDVTDGSSALTADTSEGPTTVLTGDTAAPALSVSVTLSDVVQLTFPGAGTTHHHATAAFGSGEDFVLAWTAGTIPNTVALVRPFFADGTPRGDGVQLNDSFPAGDKPDIVWDGSRYTVAWDGEQPAIWIRRLDEDGQPLGPSVVVAQDEGTANTPDLAVAADGSGLLVWNLADLPLLGEGGGMHLMQAFDSSLSLTGPRAVMSISAMTTPDAALMPDGSYATVWTEAYDHPLIEGERYYEVHGRLYRADGTAHSFRADDLDSAWPSRPAVAAAGDRLAVSWRDKTSSRGEAAGAYGRLFEADGTPLGPSVLLGAPGHDGDRCVVALSERLALFFWQHTDGTPESWMRVIDPRTGVAVTDAMVVTPPGDRADERPSVDAHFTDDGATVLLSWESRAAGSDVYSIWSRRVDIDIVDPAGR